LAVLFPVIERIAQSFNGRKLRGQTITDILPHSTSTNVTGAIKESPFSTTNYTAAALAGPLENTTKFYSALWNPPLFQDTALIITFGTDSGLTTAPGWDNVTGLGTPNGKAFADAFGVLGPFSK
jgi:hypothetical protein